MIDRILAITGISLVTFFGSGIWADEKPNLLFIYLDDFGWKDTSYMGSDFYETPHLDSLAGEGMVFTNAYSASANCAPARACLFSGQYTPRHQVFNVGTEPRGETSHRRLGHVPGVDTLDPSISTWAQQLQAAGYQTATMGKWHLSDDPIPYGFDLNIGGTHSGSPPRGYYPPHPRAPGLQDVPKDEFLTDTITNRAADYIRDQEKNPWVLYLTLFSVHTPLNAKKELLDKYQQKEPGELHNHAAMATMIEAMDSGVGRIVKALEETGQSERTIVVFFSDNGGYGPATDMAPLKGYKGTYYEGGIRVPFFVKWPGVVKAGETNPTPIIGVDLFPTFCEMLDAPLPEGQKLDGESLVPLLKGVADPKWESRSLYWFFPAYLQSYNVDSFEQRDPLFRSRPCAVVRKGNWKLHHYFEDDAWELYNLETDIAESNNLADSEAEKLTELQQDLVAWQKNINAPVPIEKNPEFDAQEEAKAIEAVLAKGRRKKGKK